MEENIVVKKRGRGRPPKCKNMNPLLKESSKFFPNDATNSSQVDNKEVKQKLLNVVEDNDSEKENENKSCSVKSELNGEREDIDCDHQTEGSALQQFERKSHEPTQEMKEEAKGELFNGKLCDDEQSPKPIKRSSREGLKRINVVESLRIKHARVKRLNVSLMKKGLDLSEKTLKRSSKVHSNKSCLNKKSNVKLKRRGRPPKIDIEKRKRKIKDEIVSKRQKSNLKSIKVKLKPKLINEDRDSENENKTARPVEKTNGLVHNENIQLNEEKIVGAELETTSEDSTAAGDVKEDVAASSSYDHLYSLQDNVGNRYSCKICSYTTHYRYSIGRHVRNHSIEGLKTTAEASAGFDTFKNCERLYVCSLCRFKSPKQETIKLHVKFKHNSEKKLNAKPVNRSSPQVSIPVGVVVDYDAGGKLFRCKSCNYHSRSAYTVKRHVVTHDKQQQFKCDVSGCAYTSCNIYNIQRHKRIYHEGGVQARKFQCPYCQHRSYEAYKMKVHIKSHIRVKEAPEDAIEAYTLSLKLKKETELLNLSASHGNVDIEVVKKIAAHVDRTNGLNASLSESVTNTSINALLDLSTPDSNDEDTTQKCISLQLNVSYDKTAASDTLSSNHVRQITNDKLTYCNLCSFKTDTFGKMKVHLLNHYGVSVELCPFCSAKFADTWQLKKHVEGQCCTDEKTEQPIIKVDDHVQISSLMQSFYQNEHKLTEVCQKNICMQVES